MILCADYTIDSLSALRPDGLNNLLLTFFFAVIVMVVVVIGVGWGEVTLQSVFRLKRHVLGNNEN